MISQSMDNSSQRPDWLKVKLSTNSSFKRIKELNQRLNLRTVCQEAACPNIGTCWSGLALTYILLGKNCSRSCKFCNVSKADLDVPDPNEPERVAQAIRELGLDYVVLTSVTRDDLKDKGLSGFIQTVFLIKQQSPHVKIELLIPDFANSPQLLERIAYSGAEVIGHDIETVRGLYPEIRPDSSYDKSLEVLKSLKDFNHAIITKSALLIGLGENQTQIVKTMNDLRQVSVDILYLGQYLSPSKAHWPVKKYYKPEEFAKLKKSAESLGFRVVVSEPLARSSWRAKETYNKAHSAYCLSSGI